MSKYISKCYVVRSLPLVRDSRLQRYNEFLDEDVVYITWEDHDKCNKFLRFGRKDYHLVISYPLFLLRLFVLSLFKMRKQDKVICMDLDTYIPIKLAGMFKRIKIYLDIVDPIAETKFRNFAYPKLFDWIECFIVSKSSRVILPGKSRIDYYLDKLSLTSLTLSTTPLICENVPKINRSDKFPVFNENSNNGIRIGYFGSLDDTRGILELIGFFKNRPDFRILIAGMGSLDDKIKQLSTEIDNLTFLGKYEPVEIQRLYSYVDFVWAYYSPEVFLHKYACPNKYYEHLAFKVPIIVNEIIPQSQKILQMNTGIVIDNELDDNCFSKMSDMILNYSYQLSDFDVWEKEYSNYSFSID